MILRRLANSFRKQDWFTVVLEVMIVVVGIFIGLQVDDWNQARKDRIDEQVFLVRLHGDILNADNLASRLLLRRLERWNTALAATEVLFGRGDRNVLTQEECKTISSLHYFNIVVADLTSVTELTSTGRMAIIRDADLRGALAELQQSRAAVDTLINLQGSVTYDLPSFFADLITRDAYFDSGDQEIHGLYSCDLGKMQANRTFLNKFSANADAYDAYIQDGLAPWAAQFVTVHQLVDRALEIDHESENP